MVDYVIEGRKIIFQEVSGLRDLANKLDINFENAVQMLLDCSGRVIVMGVGKSGLIGKKIASTLTSTGTPSFFISPTDASHGELGAVTEQDIILIISYSGETKELLDILPSLKEKGVKIINMCGHVDSTLWKNADINLDVQVSSEADPNNLAPTTSTTAALAMGDALAMVCLKERKFRPEDFAKLHPGGMLGKRLTMKVSNLMYTGNRLPKIREYESVKDALFILTKIGLGIAIIVDNNDQLLGVFTDGDLRRLVDHEPVNFPVYELSVVMKKNPKIIGADELAYTALVKMKNHEITALVVTDENNKVVGVINIHDILREGIS